MRHHPVLYRDLSDPVAFFRGETQPELAGFWPYVFGAGGAADPELAARYSALMADSQGLVAADTLGLVDLSGVRRLMDVGGGTGAFLAAVGAAHPTLEMVLFDLPAVVPGAEARFATPGVNIGLFCSTPMVALSRNVSRKHAMEMLLTGEMISADDALRMGLVNRVVDMVEELRGATDALAARIASIVSRHGF